MSKKVITENLEHAICVHTTNNKAVFGCHEVTIGFLGNERVDYMTVDAKGIWRCYEIKTNISDFRSKAKLSFVGHYNYFVLTPELYKKVKNEIPKEIGVYIGESEFVLHCVKYAKKQELAVEENILYLSMIRSLHRDVMKFRKIENPKVIDNFKKEINQLREDNSKLKIRNSKLEFAFRGMLGRNWQQKIGL